MRILVCGTNYGSSYVRAIGKGRSSHQLVGVLSRGSRRSLELARACNVPHYTSADALPVGGVDIACVAVPTQTGIDLIIKLLRRGIHVLAEHPIEPHHLEEVLNEAAKQGVYFHLNSHYSDIDIVATFLTRCTVARSRQAPLYISALLNPRTLYSCLDIVAQAVGGLNPYSFCRLEERDRQLPETASTTAHPIFTVLQGELGGIPAVMQCQSYVSREDDASAAQVSHQIMVGFADGNLLLCEASGPVLWLTSGPATKIWTQPAWNHVSSALPPTFEAFHLQRDNANRLAIQRIESQIETGVSPAIQAREYLLDVSRAWRAAVNCLGPVDVIGVGSVGKRV